MFIVRGNQVQVVVSRLLINHNLVEQGAFCLLDLPCVLPVLQQAGGLRAGRPLLRPRQPRPPPPLRLRPRQARLLDQR